MLQTITRSARTTGIISLWDGASASILRQLTYSTTRFAMYEVMQASWRAVAKPEGGKLGAGALCACAGVAGGLGGLVGNPVEVSDGVK
jgi:dicarboxylate transporter 10